MIETARFFDSDGDMYVVTMDPSTGTTTISSSMENNTMIFYTIDALKIIEGLQQALVKAALGGHYQVGPDREQISDEPEGEL